MSPLSTSHVRRKCQVVLAPSAGVRHEVRGAHGRDAGLRGCRRVQMALLYRRVGTLLTEQNGESLVGRVAVAYREEPVAKLSQIQVPKREREVARPMKGIVRENNVHRSVHRQ